MIEVNDVTVKYGEFTAVDKVNFYIRQGEIFGLVGRNGAGKTSLVETMEGLRKSSSGSIRICGLDPQNRTLKTELYNKISVQLQDTSYPEGAKVRDLCRLFASFCQAPEAYQDLLRRFDLTSKENTAFSKLSGGQKQKLSIVLSLISRPKILFLDEITTGLDVHARKEIWEYLLSLKKQGMTILIVSHFMDDIEATCDRVGVMQSGKLTHIGSQEQLRKESHLAQTISFSVSEPLDLDFKKLDAVQDYTVSHNRYQLYGSGANFVENTLAFLQKNEVKYHDFSSGASSMEDIFVALTGEELNEGREV